MDVDDVVVIDDDSTPAPVPRRGSRQQQHQEEATLASVDCFPLFYADKFGTSIGFVHEKSTILIYL